ncbi:MAG: CDP-alcohol phosphatidyltransferase family protein [Promethearchaeota archaeon]
MLFRIKKFSGPLLTPLGRKIKHIPANVITALSLVACIAGALSAILGSVPCLILSLFLVEFFDQLDGVVARFQGTTKFGAFWDSTLDRYGDAVLFVGFMLGNYTTPLIAMLGLIGAFLTSYTRARIEEVGKEAGIKSMYGVGLFERTDRIPLLFLGAIVQLWVPSALEWTMVVMVIVTHFTALQRIWFAHTHLSHEKENIPSEQED